VSGSRVVIVGGGLSGISAALACADAGVRVTLVEADPRLGGAASSFRRGGLKVDNGQHVFLRCCAAYRGLLDRLGTAGRTVLQDRLDIPVLSPGRRVERIRRTRLPAPLHLGPALGGYGYLSLAERARAARCALALARLDPRDPALDARRFGEWLASQHQSRRAVETLWDLIALPALNLPAADASLALAAKVFKTGLLEAPGAGDIGYAVSSLEEAHAAPAEEVLVAGGHAVHRRTRAHAIERSGDELAVAADRGRFEGDAVIVAVAHTALPSIAGVAWPPVEGLGTSPIVNLHFVYDRHVAGVDFAAVLDSPLQWVFDRTRQSGLRQGQYLAVSLSAADEHAGTRTSRLREIFEPEMARLFPGAAAARVTDFFVTREKEATFRAAPGTAALRPGPATGAPGVYLAGAWTGTGWPATMEGAVRSGISAARAALIGLGRTRRLPKEVAA
jgi:squalene-associated FAD-dependent desaturase